MAELREQIQNLWGRFTPRQRWIILGSALLLFVVVPGASYWYGGKPKYVPLFTDMESKDAGDVVAKLQELKVPYEIMGNGSAIGVSEKMYIRPGWSWRVKGCTWQQKALKFLMKANLEPRSSKTG